MTASGSRARPIRAAAGALAALAVLAGAATARAEAQPDLRVDVPARSFEVPVAEVLASNVFVWSFDRYVLHADFARVDARSIVRNLQGGWQLDVDDFETNEFLHPYHGAFYFDAARSSGWGFWGGLAFATFGSFVWKIAGESGPPSINDMISSPAGGTVLGEALFRLSRLVLARHRAPGAGRWLAAAIVSPAATLNAAALDDRIRDPDPPVPPYSGRFAFGATAGEAAARLGDVTVPVQGRVGVAVTYGLPDVVALERPFDHLELSLDFSSATVNPWRHASDPGSSAWLLDVRGLVAGGATPLGDVGRLLYGAFATFDFGGPVLLRVSETGLGPGLVLALRPRSGVGLDATLIAAGTFGSAGGWAPPVGERDYHFGAGVHLLGDVRLFLGDRAELRTTARGFVVPAAAAGGDESLLLSTSSAILRLVGPHAVGADATFSIRGVHFADSRYRERSVYVGISYVYLFAGGSP